MSQKEEFLDAFESYADALYRHAYFRLGGDADRATDCVQDTFTRVWESTQKGTRINNWRAFLYRALGNRIIDEYRRKKSLSIEDLHGNPEEAGGFDPEDERALNEFDRICSKDEITRGLEKLHETYREVVTLRYIDELSPGEIADLLGEKENAVSVRIHRGLKKLAVILKNHEPREK